MPMPISLSPGPVGGSRALQYARYLAQTNTLYPNTGLFFPLTIFGPSLSTVIAADILLRVYTPDVANDPSVTLDSFVQFSTLAQPDDEDIADWTRVPGSNVTQSDGAPVPQRAVEVPSNATFVRSETIVDWDVLLSTGVAKVTTEMWVNAYRWLLYSGFPTGNFLTPRLDFSFDLTTERSP